MTHENELDYLSSTSHNYTQEGGNLLDTIKGFFTKKSEGEKVVANKNNKTSNDMSTYVQKEKAYEATYGNKNPVDLMLKSASEHDYEKVFDVYGKYISAGENNYENINFAKQDKSGNTILHYLARDYKMIMKYNDKTDNVKEKKSFNFRQFKDYIKSIPKIISEGVIALGSIILVSSIIAHPKNSSFINIQNNDGDTAAILAQKNGNYAFVDMLVEANADLDICNKLGFKIQPVTETETSNNLHKFELLESEDCNKPNGQITQSEDLRSIEVSQVGGDFFKDLKNYFTKSKKNDSDQYNGTTEDRLRYLAEKAKASDASNTNTQNYNKFLGQVAEDNQTVQTNKIAKNYDNKYTDESVETSEILKNLMNENKSNNQYKMGTSTAANELIKNDNFKTSGTPKENTDDFVNQVVAKYRKAMHNKDKTPSAPYPAMQVPGEALVPNQQTGGYSNKKNKITGHRKLFKYDIPKKSKNYMYDSLDDDNMEGGLSSDNSSMNSLQRVTQQTIRDIEDRIIANIKKIMKITDEEEARDYRSGAWYLYREKKGEALFDMKKLDKTIEFEKFITEDILKKVNIKEAKKRRLENKEKQRLAKESNSSSSSSSSSSGSNSSFTSTNSSTPTSMSMSSSAKPKKTSKATKAKKEGSIRVTEYSLESSLSDMHFSNSSSYSSSYNFSNKNILPSTTSSFNSYTSSSAF